jgi:hypothetical protein
MPSKYVRRTGLVTAVSFEHQKPHGFNAHQHSDELIFNLNLKLAHAKIMRPARALEGSIPTIGHCGA